MNIGVSRISNTREEALEVLEAARAHGFHGVQLKPSQYGEYVNNPPAFYLGYGPLAVLACGGLIVYPGDDPVAWPGIVAPILPFASAIHAGHICLCSGAYNTGATEGQIRDAACALTVIGESARRQGLVISIHNHVNSLVETEEDIARLLQRLDPEVCGLTLDTAHAAKAGIPDVSALVLRFREHLLNVHLKDLDSGGTFCALGQGTLAVQPIIDALQTVNYSQWLIVDEETASLGSAEATAIAARYLKDRNLL